MKTSVCIETPRLILRTLTMEDVEAVALGWQLDGGPISHHDAEKQVRWMLENHRKNAVGSVFHLCLAILDKETHSIIDWCGLDHRDKTMPDLVLFYLLKKSSWGKGFATEAARALLKYAFQELCFPRINSSCVFENIASKRVMEKIGMRYLGLDEAGGHSFTLGKEEYFTRE